MLVFARGRFGTRYGSLHEVSGLWGSLLRVMQWRSVVDVLACPRTSAATRQRLILLLSVAPR